MVMALQAKLGCSTLPFLYLLLPYLPSRCLSLSERGVHFLFAGHRDSCLSLDGNGRLTPMLFWC